ncbi:YgiT-type zinc finger protein [Acetobacterium tundrae]
MKGIITLCFYCKENLFDSITTHVVNYRNCLIIIKNVPCEECEQCGEISDSSISPPLLPVFCDGRFTAIR